MNDKMVKSVKSNPTRSFSRIRQGTHRNDPTLRRYTSVPSKERFVRESSNPVMRGVVRDNQTGYAGGFGAGMAGTGVAMNKYGQATDPYTQPAPPTTRQLTIDDVVTKTAITLGVLTIVAIATYFGIASRATESAQTSLALPLMMVGAIGGLVLVLVASFGRKQDNPAIVLAYAAFEGLFVGSISFVFANLVVGGDISAGA